MKEWLTLLAEMEKGIGVSGLLLLMLFGCGGKGAEGGGRDVRNQPQSMMKLRIAQKKCEITSQSLASKCTLLLMRCYSSNEVETRFIQAVIH